MAQKQGLSKHLFYEAKVVDNNDPKRLCRVRARVPFIFDGIPDEHLPWAIASFDHKDGASSGSGTAYVPQIDTKVLLKFQEADPSSPIWHGYVVDTSTKLPEMEHNYPHRKVTKLKNKTLVVVDTKSNEVFIRQPGTTRIYIEGNAELTIGGNVTEYIKGSRSSFIDGNSLEVIKGNRQVYVGGNALQYVKGNYTNQVQANYIQSTKGSSERVTGGGASISVGGDDSYQVKGTHQRNAELLVDNDASPTPSPALDPTDAPTVPDLSKWTGIPEGASGRDKPV